ncbi:2,3-bisphosphoglycerate-independent phosphoglycerate mutase [Methanocella paludicola SANAE]|uniref:2,3-bisphosphoglycerate-independent phosphoglycerate mutase n=1 Tax=Methanocella paludicola (strain DSM 17711 / JCM 13418 / NBRC 101707 / SANAE) TaxID=304371 RepID=D1YZZ5_METPS|nr:2,3-bisphosphoglycerate-independent phosphoglycerate mutase [Methanocella paludicola]BAI62017.1 2,3-bisphosphoglycerate-independent phosphoglycerate mutase [Methanocella paludicola SANAE]
MSDVANKILLIVLDGASDRPVGGKTPLSEAGMRNLDKLAYGGINGIMDTVGPGIRPGSDTSHLAILGYDPHTYYTGRGPFEAAGVGIDVKGGDIAFRVNFATVENGLVTDRRAGRISDTDELAKAINEKVKVPGVDIIFKRSTGHRAALVLRGKGLSAAITDTDPKKEGNPIKECHATDDTPEAKRTADIVNSISKQVVSLLDDMPVNQERRKQGLPPGNAILIRGAGEVPHIPQFQERYGLKGAVVAAAGLIIGIGKMCGLEYLPVGSMEIESSGSQAAAKMKKAIQALETYDFVLLNIKGADEAGHDGNFEKKTQFLGQADESFKDLLTLKDVLIIVTVDHSTPVSIKDHSADPVPILMHGPGVRMDDVAHYNELIAYKGGLHRIKGMDVMPIALDLINKTKKYGA